MKILAIGGGSMGRRRLRDLTHLSDGEVLLFEQAADWPEAVEASREVAELLARRQTASGAIPPRGEIRFNYESCYLREMRHFLDAAAGKSPHSMTDVTEELQTLRTFGALLRSDAEKCEVGLKEKT